MEKAMKKMRNGNEDDEKLPHGKSREEGDGPKYEGGIIYAFSTKDGVYVGSTIDIFQRVAQHLKAFRKIRLLKIILK